MVSNSKIIEVIVSKLIEYKAVNIVVDPVMVATSGGKLMMDEAKDFLINKLLPIGTVITPNIEEAEFICGFEIKKEEDMIKAAEKISETVKGGILIKGGHLESSSDDLLYLNSEAKWFKGERINNPNTHGTCCTLSSAIACSLANGFSLEESVLNAKAYITGALKANLNLGKGSGPLEHTFNI
jgi:hydroxymethylpyrimidine/phosphomethylpyrimidine kinase